MFVCKTPYRVSFFGGGSDYPRWFNKHSGEVIGSSIDKYSYLITKRVKPQLYTTNNYKFKVTWNNVSYYQKLMEVENVSFRKILFYFFSKSNFKACKSCFNFTTFSDISSGSGMGSSSAFTITLLNSLYLLFNVKKSKVTLIQEAVYVEQFILQEAVGCQDQALTCFGGLNLIKFYRNNKFKVLTFKNLSKKLLLSEHSHLFNTGCVRLSSNIASSYLKNVSSNESKIKSYRSFLKDFVHLLCTDSNVGFIPKSGDLLHKAWLIKKSLTPGITNSGIDVMYSKACSTAGVVGGKLLGAGGGGFLFLLSKYKRNPSLNYNLKQHLKLPFNFNNEGTSYTKI